MKKNPFEKSKKDAEKKGHGKEGSKREEAFDTKQMKCGGKVKGHAMGGIMRGTGAAVKGKRFTRNG